MIRRTRIKPVSDKRRKAMREYTKLRKAFLEAHPFCQWWLKEQGDECPGGLSEEYAKENDGRFRINSVPSQCPRATECHHRNGRTGTNYLDTSTWMAVSRQGHEWIHQHPSQARAKGYITT